jgi:hypothetical protein
MRVERREERREERRGEGRRRKEGRGEEGAGVLLYVMVAKLQPWDYYFEEEFEENEDFDPNVDQLRDMKRERRVRGGRREGRVKQCLGSALQREREDLKKDEGGEERGEEGEEGEKGEGGEGGDGRDGGEGGEGGDSGD